MDSLAINIKRFRKEKGITQKELAEKLNISFQAVSKWENAKAQPEISYLIQLSKIFETDLNSLLSYNPASDISNMYLDDYMDMNFTNNLKPHKLAVEVLALKIGENLKICDMASGEGNNSVFFAKNGFLVTSLDISSEGIEKTKRFAKYSNVSLNAYTRDVISYNLEENFDIIFSVDFINYIPIEKRKKVFSLWKKSLNKNGLIVLNAKIKKPFLDFNYNEFTHPFYSGELFNYFNDFFFIKSEEIYQNNECYNILIAQKK